MILVILKHSNKGNNIINSLVLIFIIAQMAGTHQKDDAHSAFLKCAISCYKYLSAKICVLETTPSIKSV